MSIDLRERLIQFNMLNSTLYETYIRLYILKDCKLCFSLINKRNGPRWKIVLFFKFWWQLGENGYIRKSVAEKYFLKWEFISCINPWQTWGGVICFSSSHGILYIKLILSINLFFVFIGKWEIEAVVSLLYFLYMSIKFRCPEKQRKCKCWFMFLFLNL